MAAIDVPQHRERTVRFPWVSATGSLIVAALFLASAVLQVVASLERWVVFRNSLRPGDVSAEDHLYDYNFPYDPWEPIGTAAQVFGVGVLVLALGILLMPLALSTRLPTRRPWFWVLVVIECVLALAVAGSFVIRGVHAIASGITGAPSPLQSTGALDWIAFIGLIVLAVMWWNSRAAVITCFFLIGSTGMGLLVAAFVIAPIVAGGTSHDTTPWTETVVAASTAAAGIAMIVGARDLSRRTRKVASGQRS
jgi:hypothetical protein